MQRFPYVLLALALGYCVLAAVLYMFQSRFVYYPEMGRGDRATPAQLRLPFGKVRIVVIGESLGDEIVPLGYGRRLYEAAGVPKQWRELAGGHNDGFILTREDWARRFDEFLQHHLPL